MPSPFVTLRCDRALGGITTIANSKVTFATSPNESILPGTIGTLRAGLYQRTYVCIATPPTYDQPRLTTGIHKPVMTNKVDQVMQRITAPPPTVQ